MIKLSSQTTGSMNNIESNYPSFLPHFFIFTPPKLVPTPMAAKPMAAVLVGEGDKSRNPFHSTRLRLMVKKMMTAQTMGGNQCFSF
jgi:hypothetical protein